MATNYIPRHVLETMSAPEPPTPEEIAALERLLKIGQSDTGQSRRVADFLLAWWNAGSCGGFDMTNLWAVDTAIAKDMTAVFGLVARTASYPDSAPFTYGEDLRAVVARWRPELLRD